MKTRKKIEKKTVRKYPIGAEAMGNGIHFRVWAPIRSVVTLVVESAGNAGGREPFEITLEQEGDGYFSIMAPHLSPGALYRFRVDDDPRPYPDPASRFQPNGPHGPSQVIDPAKFAWTDDDWPGVVPQGQVLYEMHIGTFTQQGTWIAAVRELPELAKLGVTVLEVMPVADFPGRFGWGYDGVNLYAPTRLYGTPDDFRLFVDKAHELGLGVILDVVYNHLGPDGNYLWQFSRDYFSTRHKGEWGDPFNFDDANAGPVREYVLSNAAYWIEEFHLDGLRIDATQQIFDDSDDHIMAALTRRVREAGAPRKIYVVGENEPQHVRMLLPPDKGGYGMDALWNDDFHHTAMAAMTGRSDAYYSDHRGGAQEFVSAFKHGFLYQGQWYSWQKKPRGTLTLGFRPDRFVNFIQNHDQLANSGSGKRAHLLTSPSRYRALTALFLLAPQTPMLFQGQEYAARSPFFYFADHDEEIAQQVARGRSQFLSQFRTLATPEMQARLPDPADPMTFTRCKLNHNDRGVHGEEYQLHVDLLHLRCHDPVIRACQYDSLVDGAVLNPDAFVIRYFGETHGNDRLLLVNLGRDFVLLPAPEPLLAPPEEASWTQLWSSEDPRYGGVGSMPFEPQGNWHLLGESAMVLTPEPKPGTEVADER